MNASYDDIKSRIKEEPKWYDSNGVPRYDDFHPQFCPNIYARQVVLLLISCQNCNKEFKVEMNSGYMGEIRDPRKLHYGDPPHHECTGDTMNCNDLKVLENWIENFHGDLSNSWKRDSSMEGVIL